MSLLPSKNKAIDIILRMKQKFDWKIDIKQNKQV